MGSTSQSQKKNLHSLLLTNLTIPSSSSSSSSNNNDLDFDFSHVFGPNPSPSQSNNVPTPHIIHNRSHSFPPYTHTNRKKLQEKIINEKFKLPPFLTSEAHSLLKGLQVETISSDIVDLLRE
ncbi:hypothetical protein Lal_00049635 [Lupinus albus]|nr:hypothetical protein Lal_00049635 [Lupinus albus]